jgi:hypothetical protein
MSENFTEKLEKSLPWSIIGLIATIILGIPAIWLTVRVRSPNIEVSIMQIANVFDIHRPLSDLTILFKGDDIQDKKQNLQIVTLTIENNGEEDVLQGGYDLSQPIGIQFQNAQIVGEPRIFETNSKYLAENLQPRESSANTIEFKKVIFERGKSVTIEVLILHDQSKVPAITTFGKIAGQEYIGVHDLRDSDKPTFWRTLGNGGILINATRFIISILVFIFGIVALIQISEMLSRVKVKRNAKRARKYLYPVLRNYDLKTQNSLLQILETIDPTSNGLSECIRIIKDEREMIYIASELQKQDAIRKNRFSNRAKTQL